MPEGTVKWFNDARDMVHLPRGRQGCVRAPSGDHDGRFRSLKEGDRVKFEIVEGPKGPQAANVQRANN